MARRGVSGGGQERDYCRSVAYCTPLYSRSWVALNSRSTILRDCIVITDVGVAELLQHVGTLWGWGLGGGRDSRLCSLLSVLYRCNLAASQILHMYYLGLSCRLQQSSVAGNSVTESKCAGVSGCQIDCSCVYAMREWGLVRLLCQTAASGVLGLPHTRLSVAE